MSNVHSLNCTPNSEGMHEFVQSIFAHSGQRGLVEIAYTSAKAPHALNHGRQFDLGALDEAVDYAARLNATPNVNVYFSAGLRRPGTYVHARGSDADVDMAVALWADFDKPGAHPLALQKLRELDLLPNLVTFTGNDPHVRGQAWWVLEEPTADLALHRRLQAAIASALGGDPTVVNPSRVMRLIGSVAWPLKAGRVLEMTGAVDSDTRRAPYDIAEIAAKLERAGALEPAQPTATLLDFTPSPASPAGAALFDLNHAAPAHDVASLVRAAAEPGRWHANALLAVAHLLGRGTPPDVAVELLTPMLQQPGYSYIATRNDLIVMAEGGVKRGLFHAQEPAITAELAAPVQRANPFMTVDELFALPPVEWMVESYLPAQGMSALFAPPGAFKSFLAADLALSVAYGRPWHGFATAQRRVLYVLAEGKHGFARRIRAWQQHRVDGQGTDQFVLLPVPVNFLDSGCVDQLIDAIDVHLGGVGLVVLDTLARNFGPGDENSTKDMNAYVAGTTKLAERGAHVLHVHHTGKDGSKGERGSSAFLGALDTSLKLDREPGADSATLWVKKQKDGAEAPPLRLAFPIAEASHPITGEVFTSRIPTMLDEAAAGETRTGSRSGSGLSKTQLNLLAAIGSGITSLSALAAAVSADKSNVRRALRSMQERKLIFQDGHGFWRGVTTENIESNQEDEI